MSVGGATAALAPRALALSRGLAPWAGSAGQPVPVEAAAGRPVPVSPDALAGTLPCAGSRARGKARGERKREERRTARELARAVCCRVGACRQAGSAELAAGCCGSLVRLRPP